MSLQKRGQNMIKTFLLSAVIAATLAGTNEPADIYPECGHVTWVHDGGQYCDDAVIVRVGNTVYPAFADDLEVDDFVALIMDTNGTDNVNDDKIISIKYIGRP